MITDEEFRLMCPALPSAKRAEILPALNAAMDRYGVSSDAHDTAAFLANVMKESESFQYSHEIWGPTPTQEHYEFRHDLGNTQPGDGHRYMGRGYIETTGRKNYSDISRELGVDFVAQPELLEQPKYAALSAAFFWKSHGCEGLAACLTGRRDASEQKTLQAICHRVNGGYNGLSERVAFYWRCLAVLNQHPSAVLAASHLKQAIAANPVIPTPETHTPEQIAAETQSPTPEVAAAEVREQAGATSFIDIAEATPPSVVKATARPVLSTASSKAAAGGAWFLASVKVGEYATWAALALVAAAVAYLVVAYRRDIRRVLNVGFYTLKEATVGF
jgi:putative chitinase